MTAHELPDWMAAYVRERDSQRKQGLKVKLESFTARELLLIKDAAVMGYVRGTMAPKGEAIPKDWAIVTEVVGECMAFPDLYPEVNNDR